MKIRSGFVSNSSSSSFIVRAHEAKHRKNGKFLRYVNLITAAKEKKLNEFGFFKTYAYGPHQVLANGDEQREEEKDVVENKYENYNYGYYVTCNQDEVILFLLQNKIPFVAEEHYGHYNVFYDGKETVVRAVNYGNIMATYGVSYNDLDTKKPVQKFTRKEYLKRVSY